MWRARESPLAAPPRRFLQAGPRRRGPGPGRLPPRACSPASARACSDPASRSASIAPRSRRGEFTGAVMMRRYNRVASRFTPDSALRMTGIPVGLADREEIRAPG